MRPLTKTLLIGIGSDFRADDQVGLLVARDLKEKVRKEIDVAEHHGEGTGLMELWKPYSGVIVVDAAQSGTAPAGTLHEFDIAAEPLPPRFLRYSSHQFGLAEAVQMARALSDLPEIFRVYAIEGKVFSYGEELSPAVGKAMSALVETLETELA